MIETAFIILYGLSFLGGLFLTYVWGRLAYRGLRRVKERPSERETKLDQFSLIAIGLTLGAIANVAIFGTWTVVSLVSGIDPAISNMPGFMGILFGLLVLAVSKYVLMWAHDPTHQANSWRWFALISAAWVIAVPLWLL